MRIGLLAVGLTLGTLPAFAAPSRPVLHGPAASANAILNAERSFEARSVTAGAATAFREYMDPADGLEFGSGAPVRGAAAIADDMTRSAAGQTLSWTPMEVFASTGDLGVAWGTWSLIPKPGAKAVTGRYVTVWRRNPAGAWKGLIDIGAADP